jgi:tetratricopeptide (TPR) repeat protein
VAEPANLTYRKLQMETLAYYAQALDSAGQLDLAIQQRERQLALLAPYMAVERPDAELREKAMIANRQLAHYRFRRGDTAAALSYSEAAVQLSQRLVEWEPSNTAWSFQNAAALLDQAQISLRLGKIVEGRVAAEQGCHIADGLIARDPSVVSWREAGLTCLRLKAELAAARGAREEARAMARQVLEAVSSSDDSSDRFAVPLAHKLLGDMSWRTGDRAGAIAAWKAGLSAWPKSIAETPVQRAARGEMLRGIGNGAEGMRIAAELAAKGYRKSLSNRAGI